MFFFVILSISLHLYLHMKILSKLAIYLYIMSMSEFVFFIWKDLILLTTGSRILARVPDVGATYF